MATETDSDLESLRTSSSGPESEYETSTETSSTSGTIESASGDDVWVGLTKVAEISKEKTSVQPSFNLQPSADKTISYGPGIFPNENYKNDSMNKTVKFNNDANGKEWGNVEFSRPNVRYKGIQGNREDHIGANFLANDNEKEHILMHQQNVGGQENQMFSCTYPQQQPMFWYPTYQFPMMAPFPQMPQPMMLPVPQMPQPVPHYPMMSAAPYGYPMPFALGHPFTYGPP